jgi:MSHA biogenesis protein MshN
MSIINKMLQDLDRRQGRADADATMVQQVRSVPAPRNDREWFWRIVAGLMVLALAWVGWIAWQLQPRASIATDQAFTAAQSAQRKAVAAPATAPVPATEAKAPEVVAAAPVPSAPVAAAPATAAPVAVPVPPAKPAAVAEPVKPSPAAPKPATAAAPAPPAKQAPAAAPKATLNTLGVPAPRILAGPPSAPARVEKRDRVRSPEDKAEGEFRRGAGLLNQGRAIEAEEAFAAALAVSPAHEAARQALVALHLEQHRVDEASRLLQDGLALNPAQARFGAVLARIHLERRNYAAALGAVSSVRQPEQGSAQLQFMRGSALQKMGRHAEAIEALERVVGSEPQNGSALMALAISLEAAGRRADASAAYRRAAVIESLGVEARGYAEQRARQLQ